MFQRNPGEEILTEPIQRPKEFDKFLIRYNEIKEDPTTQINYRDEAIIMIVEFQLALEKGNKHYHPTTGKELTNLTEIFEALKDGPIDIKIKEFNKINNIMQEIISDESNTRNDSPIGQILATTK